MKVVTKASYLGYYDFECARPDGSKFFRRCYVLPKFSVMGVEFGYTKIYGEILLCKYRGTIGSDDFVREAAFDRGVVMENGLLCEIIKEPGEIYLICEERTLAEAKSGKEELEAWPCRVTDIILDRKEVLNNLLD